MQKRTPVFMLLLITALAGSMAAQLNSTAQNVSLTATLNEYLTVTINSGDRTAGGHVYRRPAHSRASHAVTEKAAMALHTRERALVLLTGALLVFSIALPLRAQTVRPLLSEYKEVARGRVELVNDSAFPLTAVVSARSFHVSETGEISYGPLDSGIHLKLSAMSFRVRPQQSYYLFYEARADKLPAWFVIYVGFSGFPVRDTSGLNVQVDLPHTVYLLPKRGMQKAELQVAGAAIKVGTQLVFSDSAGLFFVRVNKAGVYSVAVLPDEFMAPGRWRTIESPTTVEAAPEESAPGLNIVVGRIADQSRKRPPVSSPALASGDSHSCEGSSASCNLELPNSPKKT